MGALFLILMIYGGFTWMTAQGNEEKIAKAKRIIVNAVIGLSIILLSKALTFLMLQLARPAVEGTIGQPGDLPPPGADDAPDVP